MIVIADSSPLNYLILIDQTGILPALYGRVVIPQSVYRELLHPNTPAVVRDWMGKYPGWLEVREVIVSAREGLEELDLGESEAIVLAQENRPDVLLLMDEESGRLEAGRRHIRTTGTLGALDDAASRGLVLLPTAIARLRETNFRASESLIQWFLARDDKRKQK